MDEDPKTIITGFAPLDFLVTLVMPSISESIIETWDNVVFELAEKAKDKGIRGINEFLQSPGGKEKRYEFNITEINQILLDKLLKGEIKTIEELKILKDDEMIKNNYNQSMFIYSIFHYKKQSKNSEENTVTCVDTIFIN
ncbi:hypothetical protein HYN56_23865 [Flavobacterium crocinum]|uniref:Uncharacterized protein n=1 Tax=Flavobacterium crocinum TaxID=2183896 RepID=A0A2S1YSP3_9FLAO|nr:hypothetical protein [Flavobacterium crocinum]AWK07101.1 hypothetical protein HYN56_23865 [Flavobacterium crocinum]